MLNQKEIFAFHPITSIAHLFIYAHAAFVSLDVCSTVRDLKLFFPLFERKVGVSIDIIALLFMLSQI